MCQVDIELVSTIIVMNSIVKCVQIAASESDLCSIPKSRSHRPVVIVKLVKCLVTKHKDWRSKARCSRLTSCNIIMKTTEIGESLGLADQPVLRTPGSVRESVIEDTQPLASKCTCAKMYNHSLMHT